MRANCVRGASEDEVQASYTGGSGTERRVHERIADASVLDDEASQTPFEDVTGLLEHSRRRRIPLENRGLQALEAEPCRCRIGVSLGHQTSDSLAPDRLSKAAETLPPASFVEADLLQQLDEARVGAQWIEPVVYLQEYQRKRAVLISIPEPLQSAIFVPESEVNDRYAVRRRVSPV